MSTSRRDFLQKATILSAGTLFAGNSLFAAGMKHKIKNPGIELWSVQHEMGKDAKGTLQQLASFGYTQVESFEGSSGIFWGMQPKEFKTYMDSINLKIFGSHCEIHKDFEKKAADAGSIGMDYLICPWIGPQKTMDDWKKVTDLFNECGDICKKNGLRFAYHNHAYPFTPLEGQVPLDYMIKNTNPATVDFEMDIYWVVTAGQNPVTYLEKYKERFRLCHIKDRIKNAAAAEENASCIVGEGSIDFPKILHVAKNTGVKYFTIEQERFDDTTPVDAAKADAAYLLKLSI